MPTAQPTPKPSRFWFLIGTAVLVGLWLVRPILLPFIAGFILAYFLDPVVVRLAALRVPRGWGSLGVLALFLLIVVLLVLLLSPLLQSQLGALIDSLPHMVESLRARFMPHITEWMQRLSPHDVEKIQQAAGSYAGTAAVWAGDILKQVVTSGIALFDVATLLIVTPVVAFYLLRDWPDVTQTVESLVPRKYCPLVLEALAEIDDTLSGFIRGQALVCLSLGLIYGLGLTLVGLKYGATVGIIAGVLSFIPYVGSSFGLIVSLILAFVQFDNPTSIGLTLAVFLTGQGLEGYVLTPKLVGGRVGLHPVWILFALFAGGSLMGFAGVLIAVPTAAVLGVLIRQAIRHYKASKLYERRDYSR